MSFNISNYISQTQMFIILGIGVVLYAIWKQQSIINQLKQSKDGWLYMIAKAKELGFNGVVDVTLTDLFRGRSLFEWLYLIALSVTPIILEFVNYGKINDPIGLFASVTGVICVVLVGEGRASNYLFGLLSNTVYWVLSLNAGFYGELMTTAYFLIMQPIGLLVWIGASRYKAENQEFVSKRLDAKGWLKYGTITVIWWLVFGFIYQGIGSQRPFRDSVTDGTNGVGQLLQTATYAEQWLFWGATNVFSLYLWWGTSFQMQVMYWLYLINSIYGFYQWHKQAKQNA